MGTKMFSRRGLALAFVPSVGVYGITTKGSEENSAGGIREMRVENKEES